MRSIGHSDRARYGGNVLQIVCVAALLTPQSQVHVALQRVGASEKSLLKSKGTGSRQWLVLLLVESKWLP